MSDKSAIHILYSITFSTTSVLRPIYTRRYSGGISRGIAHLSNQRTFIYFCVTPERYRARSLLERFSCGIPLARRALDQSALLFWYIDCWHSADGQVYVGQWLRRLDKYRSGECTGFVCTLSWFASMLYIQYRYNNRRKLCLWNSDIFENTWFYRYNSRAHKCA